MALSEMQESTDVDGLQRVIVTGKSNRDGEINMIHDLMYIELKTGYSDDGPAWIGYVKT